MFDFTNGYGMEEEEYNILLERLYGFEEYYYYKQDKHYRDYLFVINELDKIKRNVSMNPSYKNAIIGWYIFFKNSKRFIQTHHSCFRITDACQLHCKHCYNQNMKRENKFMSYDEFLFLFHKIHEVAEHFAHYTYIPDDIYDIEGGEPTLNPELSKIIHYLNKQNCGVIILTNGFNMPDEIISSLKKNSKNRVQVSIDGFQNTHDMIRGNGSYERAINIIKCLSKEGIRVHANMVFNNLNYYEYPKLKKYVKSIGAEYLGNMVYIPQNDNIVKPLDRYNLKNIFDIRKLDDGSSCTDRNSCRCGHQTLIREDGGFQFCGKSSLKSLTNLFKDNIDEILYKMKLYTIAWRSVPVYCFDCQRVSYCLGGATCSRLHESNKFSNLEDRNCKILNWKIQNENYKIF